MVVVSHFFLQIIHDSCSKLENLKDLSIILELKLPSAVTVETHPTRIAVCTGGGKWSTSAVKCGTNVPVFVATLNDDKSVELFFEAKNLIFLTFADFLKIHHCMPVIF